MPKFVKKVENKLNEYGIEMIQNYQSDNQRVIRTDNMILFVDERNTIGLAFDASTKPEDVARLTLLLNEIEAIDFIHVMDSYYNLGEEMITGDEAHKFVRDSIKIKTLADYAKHEAYKCILEKEKGFEC